MGVQQYSTHFLREIENAIVLFHLLSQKCCQNVGNGISGNLGFKIYQGERTPAVLNASFPVSELPGSVTFLPLYLEDTISQAKCGYFTNSTLFHG